MKDINIGTKRHTVVQVADEPGQGGACHEYYVMRAGIDKGEFIDVFSSVHFQNGPVKEVGVNGCYMPDLIAICIHRLRDFQSGEFKCRENALALTKLEEALHWLKHRTDARIERGVEGTNRI